MVDNGRSRNTHDIQLAHEILSAQTGTTVLNRLFTVIAIVSQFAWSYDLCTRGLRHLEERTTPMVTCSRRTRYRLRGPRKCIERDG